MMGELSVTFSLYNKSDTYLVVGGMVFYHILVLGLCAFWVYRFAFVSYNPDVFVLIAIFVFGTMLCDILLSRVQGFSRFLIRCKINKQGFTFHKPFGKSYQIDWTDIQSYGLLCLYSDFSYNLLYFSKCKHERNVKTSEISAERISFQIDPMKWDAIKWYIPSNISANIQIAMDSKRSRSFFINKT